MPNMVHPITVGEETAFRLASELPVVRLPYTVVRLLDGSTTCLAWPLDTTIAMVSHARSTGVLRAPRRLGHGEIRLTAIPLSAVVALDESNG